MLKQGNLHIHFRFYVLGRLTSGQGVENLEPFWFVHYRTTLHLEKARKLHRGSLKKLKQLEHIIRLVFQRFIISLFAWLLNSSLPGGNLPIRFCWLNLLVLICVSLTLINCNTFFSCCLSQINMAMSKEFSRWRRLDLDFLFLLSVKLSGIHPPFFFL